MICFNLSRRPTRIHTRAHTEGKGPTMLRTTARLLLLPPRPPGAAAAFVVAPRSNSSGRLLRQRRSPLARSASVLAGGMMAAPLLISSLIEHADRHHPDAEIVSRRPEDGALHRYTYRDLHRRSKQLANALRDELGVREGDVVGTLALNTYRHMELYYAVSGMGGVLHTLNPRLFPDTLAWIARHAEDQVIFFDSPFLPLVKALAPQLGDGVKWVCMVDEGRMPGKEEAGGVVPSGLLNYETLVKGASPDFRWPVFEETRASSLCYTSGTTGKPKGVLYSHRSTLLHSYAAALPDSLNISARDVVLPVVPLFHVNAWGIPYAAALVGCKLVLPGAAVDGKSLYELMEAERVTLAAGVPTVWLGLLNHVKSEGARFSTLARTVVGGAACSETMLKAFVEDYGVDVLHAWGMTELSPLGTSATLKGKHLELSKDEQFGVLYKQGRAIFGVDLKLVDLQDPGKEVPWDAQTMGELAVRGNWVVSRYFKKEDDASIMHVDGDGVEWFLTGDVATIDPDGYMHIADRSKDVIKTGGEWVSSQTLENVAMSHPQVALAAVIGVPHPKWDERPLLVVVKKEGAASPAAADLTAEELLKHFQGRVAKWWIPDDVVFLESIPLGPTGKVVKTELRDRLKGYQWPPRRRRTTTTTAAE